MSTKTRRTRTTRTTTRTTGTTKSIRKMQTRMKKVRRQAMIAKRQHAKLVAAYRKLQRKVRAA